MRNIIPIILIAASVSVGCHSPSMLHPQTASSSMSAPPLVQPMLITSFCTQTSPEGTWRIGVSQNFLEVARFSGLTGEGWPARSTVSPTVLATKWTAHAGWFVFTENVSRVWAYDGDRQLLLHTFSEGWNKQNWAAGSGASYVGNYPCAVPAEVFARLSEPAQKATQKRE